MKIQSAFNKKGITLIELLVALAISAIVLAGVYQIIHLANQNLCQTGSSR